MAEQGNMQAEAKLKKAQAKLKKYGMSTDTSIRVMNCSKSGEIIKEGINLCPYCGKKVDMD